MIGKRLEIANKKAIRMWKKYHPEADYKEHFEFKPHFGVVVGSYRKCKCMCSDPFCCGNPRHKKGKNEITRQEKLAPKVDDWD